MSIKRLDPGSQTDSQSNPEKLPPILIVFGGLSGDVGPAGYMIGYALAESNLRLGWVVVADSVNPLAVTRDAWRRVAAMTSSDIVEIEVVCSDKAEHRRRVETRSVDVAGLVLPSWQDVLRRDYEPWDKPSVVLDTANSTVSDAIKELQARLYAKISRPPKPPIS
jgi:predicted kinase